MHFVYILKSRKSKALYIGCTNNLVKRFREHNTGLVQSTRPYIPWRLVYYEAYVSEKEAYHREHNLKLRSNAWNQLKKRINGSIEMSD
jgi:putative endonuclease